MDQSDTDGTRGQRRRKRVTPRQLWAKGKTRPAQDESESRPEPQAEAADEAEPGEEPVDLVFAPDSPPEGQPPEDVPAHEEDAERSPLVVIAPAVEDEEAGKGGEPPDALAGEESAEAEGADRKGPRMVPPELQPGSMHYPYATHGRAPQDEESGGASLERRISAGFVLGVLIVVSALAAGLALVSQARRIGRLEQRMEQLEQSVNPAPPSPAPIGE